MIKFFRKIRQKLLSENKTGKYFKYAFGEILLVVVGILIALSINNWNENKQNSTKEQKYLLGLKNDLANQINILKERKQFYDFIINRGESILVDFSAKGKLQAIDSINTKLSVMMYALSYPNIKTTFNELNTTGQINLIQKDSLRSKIIKYYQDSDESTNNVDMNIDRVFYNQVFPIIKSSLIIQFENLGYKSKRVEKQQLTEKLISTFENNLSNPSKEFEIINAISLRVILADTNKGFADTLLAKAEQLLNEINAELSERKHYEIL